MPAPAPHSIESSLIWFPSLDLVDNRNQHWISGVVVALAVDAAGAVVVETTCSTFPDPLGRRHPLYS